MHTMNGALLLILASVCFLAGYFLYAKLIERKLGVDPSIPTPAHTKKDGVDFIPAHPTVLFGHHFAAIAGAGPIVGPVLAAEFGGGSVALWIVLGCIFIGAAHDMISLFLSIRHGGESIGSVIGTVLGRPGKVLFLLFSWSALVLVVAASDVLGDLVHGLLGVDRALRRKGIVSEGQLGADEDVAELTEALMLDLMLPRLLAAVLDDDHRPPP